MSVGGGSQEAPVQARSVWGNSHTSPRLCQKLTGPVETGA